MSEPCKAPKVAIIGTAPSSKDLAPYDDDSFEIWTCSDLVSAGHVPRFTRHFEFHPLQWFVNRGDSYYKWLCEARDKPIYLRALDPAVPAGIVFPKETLIQRFGTYFTNTISWMIAYAIHVQAECIHLYGVDMATDTEYGGQRPSCEFFLGWAQGAGIPIHIPPQSDLLKARKLYGFDHEGEMGEKWLARRKELRQRLEAKRQEMEQATREACFLEGALESHGYYKQWI